MKTVSYTLALLLVLASIANANFISKVWPEKNIAARDTGDSKSSKRVLIGGVTSAFKGVVLKNVIDSLTADSVYVKTVALKNLQKEDPKVWGAVVIFNTCIAWDLEDAARKLIARFPDYRSFVCLITSGDPKGCGSSKNLPAGVDAISTASVKGKEAEIAKQLLIAIRERLKNRHDEIGPVK
jgi:hypothetical protein